MTPSSLEAKIPEDKREAVHRALAEAFGAPALDEVSQITKGRTTSLVYRIVAGGEPYLLKVITRNESPARHYACMRSAAEAGLAPRVLYTNEDDRVSVTDYVAATRLSIQEARGRMPGVLRALHALPAFDAAPYNTTCTYLFADRAFAIGPSVSDFLQRFRASNIVPESLCTELFAVHAQLGAAYPKSEAAVPCHNDLFKPDNILFDERRVWLVDWEAACANDRYADLAVVANQLLADEDEEAGFLAAYSRLPMSIGWLGYTSCGKPPTCSTRWPSCSSAPWASRSTGTPRCPATTSYGGGCGAARRTWWIKPRS